MKHTPKEPTVKGSSLMYDAWISSGVAIGFDAYCAMVEERHGTSNWYRALDLLPVDSIGQNAPPTR